MGIRLGPLLYARTADSGDGSQWCFDVRVLTDASDQPTLELSGDASAHPPVSRTMGRFPGRPRLWTWRVTARRQSADTTLTYRIRLAPDWTHEVDAVAVPALGALPRLSCFSCSGFAKPSDARGVADPEAVWKLMGERHRRGIAGGSNDDPSGYHLLVGMGDQVYADSIPAVKELDEKASAERGRLRHSANREDRAVRDYVELYERVWSYPAIRAMMSRIPAVHTWDDHDIMDGWGSHRDDVQKNPAYLDLFTAARLVYAVVQLGGDDDGTSSSPPLVRRHGSGVGSDHFLQHISFREEKRWLDVILPDQRTHRTPEQVMSEAQWQTLGRMLDSYAAAVDAADTAAPADSPIARHVLVVSAIPLVYVRSQAAAWIFEHLVPGVQGQEDDLRDQWQHRAHLGERARLIHNLMELRRRTGAEVTVLSGDVHVASWGKITSRDPRLVRQGEAEATVMQLISSAIVNIAPGHTTGWFLEQVARRGPSPISSSVQGELLEMEDGRRIVSVRNYLSVAFDNGGDGALWAEWVMEDGLPRRQAVIHPRA